MSKGVNKVILLGNLGKDVEVKYTQGGLAVASFSLATAERRKDKDGNWQDHAEWHQVKAFGKIAEVAEKYLSKGSSAHVIGRLQTSSWDDKDSGQKRYKTEVIVDDLTLVGGKGERSSEAEDTKVKPVEDEDIPF